MVTPPGGIGAEEIALDPLTTKTMFPCTLVCHAVMSGPGSLVSALWTMKQMWPGGQFPGALPGFKSIRKPAPRSGSIPAGVSGEPQDVPVTWSPHRCRPHPS